MSRSVRAFWWSPRRDPRVLAHELRDHASGWARLALARGPVLTNHGDELSAVVLREVLGRPVRWAPLGREDVVAVGSAMVPYLTRRGRGLIWGTGLHTPELPADVPSDFRERVLAVRGPLARAALALDERTPLGDPGLVVRALRPGLPDNRRRGTVLITHFTSHADQSDRAAIRALRAAGMRVLSPTLTPDEMLREIGSAEHVVSAGMHGVILAHALRTPATLVSLHAALPSSPSFKYHDYHHSVGLEARATHWSALLGAEGRRAAHSAGAADVVRADRTIDSLVAGLIAAAAPLRSS
ncbi:polysaccharide pyruvyl transferase family protein [Curtobacterium sp. B8]|uniref:polysaccharide pyruvyl transferase family protein n=1 Tax=Curtobacterium sp. B8 TaxID=95611 RepID=UPI000348A8A6|nr:polysaccharide pyruvyl transferase family protein [Curtobacterium sp. B8]